MPKAITEKSWNIPVPDPDLQARLSAALDVDPILAQLLINRGITDPAEARIFMDSTLADLHDPFLLTDMDQAVARVRRARQRSERVLVFGDYDVDGITSTAVLYSALSRLGLEVVTHLPHRINDGYGLSENVVDLVRAHRADLLITVDCGITACAAVDRVNALGVDVIIVDHHEPDGDRIPAACAVVDPKRHDCAYPFKQLAAVGLAAKFAQALTGELPEEYLDLVALGTIVDVVPLRGENRILVKAGLPLISQTRNKGLAALLEVSKIKGKALRPYHAGFVLGPRINATGRMGSAQTALDLLLCADHAQARGLAQDLEELNVQRQKLQRDTVQDALSLVAAGLEARDDKVIVVSKPGWHKGVLGIVASRLAETYFRPAIVISLEEGVGTASARSIAGFHLHEALTACSGSLETFGGHQLAAGLTIREENISSFREAINGFAAKFLPPQDLLPTLNIDHEIPLSGLSLELVQQIDRLEPYGEGNPEPVFCSRQLTVKGAAMVMARETLKFWVTDGQVSISAVGFGFAPYRELIVPGARVDLAYQLIIDDWNKAPVVQLKLRDIKRSDG